MNGLVMLKEHVDDTEDLINIELDNRCAHCLHTHCARPSLQLLQAALSFSCSSLQAAIQSNLVVMPPPITNSSNEHVHGLASVAACRTLLGPALRALLLKLMCMHVRETTVGLQAQ